jgi:SAM-dependent methyltransferase
MYDVDLAWIHHRGFSEFAESASGWIASVLPKGTVVEMGCGSGVLARALADAGFTVIGFDASAAMIELARETAPRARFEVARFAEAAIPACQAIVAMGEVLNYGTLGEVRTLIANAARALRPGGVLLFDVAERGSYPPFDERRIGGDDFSVIAIKESDGARLTRRVLTFRRIDGDEVRRSEEVHELELYERQAMLELLRPHFNVRVRRSYGSRRLPKGHAVYHCIRQ